MLPIFLLLSCHSEAEPTAAKDHFSQVVAWVNARYPRLDAAVWVRAQEAFSPSVSGDSAGEEAGIEAIRGALAMLQDPEIRLTCNGEELLPRPPPLPTALDPALLEQSYLTPSPPFGAIRAARLVTQRGKIAYLRAAAFDTPTDEATLRGLFDALGEVGGVIVDVRGNTGARREDAGLLAQFFVQDATIIGEERYRSPTGGLSMWKEQTIEPLYGGRGWTGPVVLLIDGGCQDGCVELAWKMAGLPNVTVVGQPTAGGGNQVFEGALPNGCVVTLPTSERRDRAGRLLTEGVAPTVAVGLDPVGQAEGVDTVVETALGWLGG